jgi:hypothetical protein
MAKAAASIDQRLDELYREHPERFTAGRNRLVKELRAAGVRDEAERIKKLKRPTMAAWLINRAALSSPKELQEFADASRELEQAQTRALRGKDDGPSAFRAAAARERDAADAVLELARKVGADADHPASERALELVGETLRAASADPELREQVLQGRVEREQSAATLGTPAVVALPKRDSRSAKRREAAEARREVEQLEAELAEAETRQERLQAQVEQSTEALRRDKARLADGKRETAALRRKLKAAQRRPKR